MDTEKRTPKKISSPDIELEIDLLEGQGNAQKTEKVDSASVSKSTGNKEVSAKEDGVKIEE